MTSPAVELRIRPPTWARVWIVVFLPFWLWAWSHRSGFPGPGGWLVAAAAVALAARMYVMGVVATADGRLVVRNQLWTRTLGREELADAVVDRANGPVGLGWTVWLVLRDGSRHRVQLTETPFLRGFRGRLERDADRLRAWIRAGNPPLPP